MVEVIPTWVYWGGAFFGAVMTSLVGLVALHYRSVQTGKLVPRTTVDLIESKSAATIASQQTDIADLKQVTRVQGDTLRIQAAQIDEFTELSRIQEAVMRALPRPGQ